MSLEGPLNPNDLCAFQQYLSRIQALHEPHYVALRIPTVVLSEVLHWSAQQHLLQNLRLLQPNKRFGETHHPLIGPSLQKLCIKFGDNRNTLLIISHLSRAALNLEQVEIRNFHPANCAILGQIGSLRSLKLACSLVINPSSFAKDFPFADRLISLDVEALSLLPSWVEENSPASAITIEDGAHVQFPALTHLILNNATCIDSIPHLLQYIIFPNLQHLTVTCPKLERQQSRTLFSALLGRNTRLRSLTIQGDYSAKIHLSDVLKDAFPQNIHTLHITASLSSTFKVESMRGLAFLFPCLQDLHLMLPETGLITLNRLSELARLLPSLVHLSIGICAQGVSDNGQYIPLRSHRLKTLCVTLLRADDSIVFARYVDRIFPFTSLIKPQYSQVKGFDAARVALRMMRQCRLDEQDRLASS